MRDPSCAAKTMFGRLGVRSSRSIASASVCRGKGAKTILSASVRPQCRGDIGFHTIQKAEGTRKWMQVGKV